MWWTAMFKAYDNRRLRWVPDYTNSYVVDYTFTELNNFEPYPVRVVMRSVFVDLIAKKTEELYVLKSLDDPCEKESGIDCYGLDAGKVKPLIVDALVFRQTSESHRTASSGVSVMSFGALIAFLALLVSCGALVVSYLTYRGKTLRSPIE